MQEQRDAIKGKEQRKEWQEQLPRLRLIRDCHNPVALTHLPGLQRMLKGSGVVAEKVIEPSRFQVSHRSGV